MVCQNHYTVSYKKTIVSFYIFDKQIVTVIQIKIGIQQNIHFLQIPSSNMVERLIFRSIHAGYPDTNPPSRPR